MPARVPVWWGARLSSRLILLLLLVVPAVGAAPEVTLKYRLHGVEGKLAANVRAFLGSPPDTGAERLNFLVTAEERVTNALQALGYYSADVLLETDRSEAVWQLDIHVTPNEPVRIRRLEIRFLGDSDSDPVFAELRDSPPLAVGEVLHHGDYEQYKRDILAVGQRFGFFAQRMVKTEVRVEIGASAADVLLVYDSGERHHFGALLYDDELLTRSQLRALARFRPGDPFDLDRLQALQADLQRTRYFSSVILRPALDQVDGATVPIRMELHPAPRHSFNVGLGYRTDVEERASVTWRTPRINRAGHSQETRLEYSQVNPSGRITYNIPLSHPLNDILQLGARVEDNEFGDLESRQEELRIRRELTYSRWVTSYSLRALNESWDTQFDRRENDYLLPGFTLSRRMRTGSLVDPDSAFSQFYQLEGAAESAGSDVDLVRAYARFGYITRFGERHRWVARGELGAALISEGDRGDLAPSLNFFAGGSQSIRGFSYQSIGNEIEVEQPDGETRRLTVGGDRLVTASLEYQYDFLPNWRAALFADFGDAFDDGEFDANYAAGFGLHFLTQAGAIRAQLAYPISEDEGSWRFHFDIGVEF